MSGRTTQRDAVAMAFGWDRSEVTEYQYGRHRAGRVHLFDAGDGYACAVKAGSRMPFVDFGPWRKVDSVAGWDVYQGAGAGSE